MTGLSRLDVARDGSTTVTGDLTAGSPIPLDWAADSQMACFPATRFDEFAGSHVFYALDLPKFSTLTAKVAPADPADRINVWGLSGHDGMTLPPDISRCVSCEAGYEVYAGTPSTTGSAGPMAIELVAINNPYGVLLAVAGAKGVTAGAFTLDVAIAAR